MKICNYKQIYAIQNANRERIKRACSETDDYPGIYILTRAKDGFNYAYVGQAKRILSRLAQHLSGYKQHIDLSLRKYGLYSQNNLDGWKIDVIHCLERDLDKTEKKYIKEYADKGYQLYNATLGGQNEGKNALKETVRKGYQEGLHNGYEKARKEVAHWFDLHLTYYVKKQGNKNQEKAKAKFEEFINVGD